MVFLLGTISFDPGYAATVGQEAEMVGNY